MPRLLPILIGELKRRGVLRAAGLYLVGSWIIIQVVATTFPPLGIGERWIAAAVIVAIAGFPVTVLAAWLYRFGVDVESERMPEAVGVRGRELRFTVGLAMLVGVGLLGATGWLALRPEATSSDQPAGASADTRLAVLYFSFRSNDSAQAYLSGALTETLIGQLDGIEGLTVISSNGVRPYRDSGVAPDSIGTALKVGLLVGGSVMVADGRARVTVELTDAATGDVLVTHRIERSLDDPFALVDDVVQEAAKFLRAQVGAQLELQRWRAGTHDPEAWRLLQRARELDRAARELLHRGGPQVALASLAQADSLLVLAERLDPSFIEATLQRAWLEYGRAYLLFNPAAADREGGRAAIAAGVGHADRVLGVQHQNAAAFEVRGVLRELLAALAPPASREAKDALLDEAEHDLRAALAIEPGRARSLSVLSGILQTRGNVDEALATAEQAYRADAYLADAANILNRLFTLSFDRSDDESAERWCGELRRRDDGQVDVAFCELLLDGWATTRRPDVALAWRTASAPLASAPPQLATFLRPHLEVLTAAVIARVGLSDSARAVLQRATRPGNGDPELLQLEAGVRLMLGERDTAAALLRSYVARRPGTTIVHSRRFQGITL